MRLGADASLDDRVRPILDRRLLRDADQPLALALSGGGDSLALALVAHEWAAYAGRSLLILTVDHRLQPQSAAWTMACAAIAKRLGARFQALHWEGAKPTTGLAAAAREARHALLAEAARKAGARVILMGHTADDVLEAQAMRAAGSTTPDPKAWAPSPAWPEGRGLFLLRPLLGVRRAELRDWLTARGEAWIDDPANANPASARVRARETAAEAPDPQFGEAAPILLAEECRFDPGGGVHLPRQAVRAATLETAQAFIGIAAVCVGGKDRRPATDKLRRTAEILRGSSAITTTLAGARLEASEDEISILREPGEAKRGGLATLYLTPGHPVIWDGRFELTASRPGLYVDRLEGFAPKLTKGEQNALQGLNPKARLSLPVIVDDKAYASPVLASVKGVALRPLVEERLWAACGLIEREPF
ncbi:MAG: tRNA lysidine(34) synthetase TilS [Phenylobacterium sp.]